MQQWVALSPLSEIFFFLASEACFPHRWQAMPQKYAAPHLIKPSLPYNEQLHNGFISLAYTVTNEYGVLISHWFVK